MKKVSLISFLIAALFSLNVFALDGHGYRVLSETIEHSPGAAGWFKPDVSNKSPGLAMSWSQAYNAEGRAGMNVMVRGNHSISVTNYTNQNQIYTYKYELNCDGQYFRKVDKVEVRPGGVINDRGDSYLSTYHRQKGLFAVNASTEITGESSHKHMNSATLRVLG